MGFNTLENKTLDVLTIGRSSVDLYGEQHGGRLERMDSFAKYVGGCPTNIAVGSARLGLQSAVLTRVGADHMGRYLLEELEREGVNTNSVVTDQDRLTALVILGIRDKDTFPLIFYRENCADMAICTDDVDADVVSSARSVLITGTHLSEQGVYDASMKAARLIKDTGGKLILDIDYRPVLWGLASKDAGENRFVADQGVTDRLQSVVGLCDLIVGTEEEFQILGGSEDLVTSLKAVRAKTGALLVCKLGADGCVAFEGEVPDTIEEGLLVGGFPIEVFNVLGAGDAFMSGFLSGWLREEPIADCCRRANACGALVVSRHGCAPAMPSRVELDHFLTHGSKYEALRKDPVLEQLHWSTNRHLERPSLLAFAIDHRVQFSELAQQAGVGDDRITAFKKLAFEAFCKVADGQPEYGMLFDGDYGEDILSITADFPYWMARPIEMPGSRPLRFVGGLDPAVEIGQWPAEQVVKCLVHYHPDDSADLKQEQEARVKEAFEACRANRREFLLEIVASKYGDIHDDTVASVIHRFYDIGVFPDWWKLEPSESVDAWAMIGDAIESRDPYCRGVVVLGLSTELEELCEKLGLAAANPIIKGFAVGRTVFHAAAKAWFAGEIDDTVARQQMAERFERLVSAWRDARRD